MTRRNSDKINAIKEMPNVFETEERLSGTWYKDYFENQNPLVLELGCGKGEFSIALGQAFPDKNFIGIDIKGPRIWRAATVTEELGLKNVAFGRFRIEYIGNHFQNESVSEIWIPFPDPFPRTSKSGRRLSSPEFLERYKPLLKSDAILHFKTDNTDLFDWTLDVYKSTLKDEIEIIEYTTDLHHSELLNPYNSIPSKYEKQFMAKGETIKYLKFRFKN